jgi:hypothetical protein
MQESARYTVGQLIAWPTLSPRCVLVDEIAWNALCSDGPAITPETLPPYHAVVFEVLKNGEALAAYNGRFTSEQLTGERVLPVLWLRHKATNA